MITVHFKKPQNLQLLCITEVSRNKMSATWTRTALCAARGAAQKIRPGAGMSPAQVAMPLQGSMEARRLFSAKVWPREDDKVWQAIPAHGSCSMADAEPAVKNQAGNICTPCETSCGVMLPPDLSCWSCQKARPSARCADNLFCGNCGSVQPPAPKCNYFELIGISEEKFDLNLKELEQKYKALVRKLHPDQFMQHGTRPIEFSEVLRKASQIVVSSFLPFSAPAALSANFRKILFLTPCVFAGPNISCECSI